MCSACDIKVVGKEEPDWFINWVGRFQVSLVNRL